MQIVVNVDCLPCCDFTFCWCDMSSCMLCKYATLCGLLLSDSTDFNWHMSLVSGCDAPISYTIKLVIWRTYTVCSLLFRLHWVYTMSKVVLCCRTILLQLAGFTLLVCGMMIYNNLFFRPLLIRHNCLSDTYRADSERAMISHPDGKTYILLQFSYFCFWCTATALCPKKPRHLITLQRRIFSWPNSGLRFFGWDPASQIFFGWVSAGEFSAVSTADFVLKSFTSGRFRVGVAAPLLTGCILEQVKILIIKCALFMHRNLTDFLGKGCASFPDPIFYPFLSISEFWIHHWLTQNQGWKKMLSF